MFQYDDLIRDALIHPKELWHLLDSFWRNRTTPETSGLVLYETYAQLIAELNTHSRAQHFIQAQTVPLQQSYWKVPFWPLVIFQSQLQDSSFRFYGEEKLGGGFYVYDDPPELVYGQAGDPQFLFPAPCPIADIPQFTDSITDSQVVIDPSQFTFDRQKQEIAFGVDLFTILDPKTDQVSGEQYVVLWMRNADFELTVPYDWTGWVVKYFQQPTDENYGQALKYIWELVLLGPSLERLQQGLMAASSVLFAREPGTVVGLDIGPTQVSIITDGLAYTTVGDVVPAPAVAIGDQVQEGEPLTTGYEFLEYEQVLSSTSAEIPGLVFSAPLSTGAVAQISVQNTDTVWSYDAGRPSPWRFPIGGAPADIEQFWVDVDAYATANAVDLAVVYGLSLPGPNAVNPLKRWVQDLLQNSLYVISTELENLPAAPGGFFDRARQLLPLDTLIILLQLLPDIDDSYDLGTETSDTVGYGYHADIPTEVISESGTDLTFFDYAPLVVVT